MMGDRQLPPRAGCPQLSGPAERDSSCVRRSFGDGQQDRRAASAGLPAASLLKDLVVFGYATDQEGQDHLRARNQIQF